MGTEIVVRRLPIQFGKCVFCVNCFAHSAWSTGCLCCPLVIIRKSFFQKGELANQEFQRHGRASSCRPLCPVPRIWMARPIDDRRVGPVLGALQLTCGLLLQRLLQSGYCPYRWCAPGTVVNSRLRAWHVIDTTLVFVTCAFSPGPIWPDVFGQAPHSGMSHEVRQKRYGLLVVKRRKNALPRA